MADVLTDAEIESSLAALPGWSYTAGKLHKEIRFKDFNEAFGFMTRVALLAEKLDHHPDWSNSWNTVVMDIVNHAAGGVTKKCIDLALAAHAMCRTERDDTMTSTSPE